MAQLLSLVANNTPTVEMEGEAGERAQLQAALSGVVRREESALSDLYELSINKVYGFVYSLLRNTADAEEVAEDVYLAVWNGVQKYDDSRGTIMSWLLTMCRSRALDRLRINKRHDRLAEAVGVETAAIQVGDALCYLIDDSKLAVAMGRLPDLQQQVLSLAYFGGYTHSEIATVLGMSLGTVKTHIRRTVQGLREVLET